jgi:hypothetical protein
LDLEVVCAFLDTGFALAPMASVWLNKPKANNMYKNIFFKEDKFTKSKCKKRYKIIY